MIDFVLRNGDESIKSSIEEDAYRDLTEFQDIDVDRHIKEVVLSFHAIPEETWNDWILEIP